ncbi:allophanate hydrolase [Niveibacterium sp. SC-1]|uniref:allophanate hydrolase n=1 Tax=Niveibacterium sp. SC-1 TaxID=3135646 RepID=UPI00311E2559
MSTEIGSLDFASLQRAYAQGLSPAQLIREVYGRIAARGEDHVWLHLLPEHRVLEKARALEVRRAAGESLPLYGLPYGVKDNIDVAGLPTTAGCDAFTYVAERSAAVVARLEAAGALLLGKQNLDQFATGLVGIRTVGGHCRNALDARYIPGGSSSGSAVAVAAGLTSFSIGSDTGGSGRVPAALNNIVGLKPAPGRVSSRGFVYCNRSFDVPPVFALTVPDAHAVLEVIAGFDGEDAYSDADAPIGDLSLDLAQAAAPFRFAVPRAEQLEFFGDEAARAQFDAALAHLHALGGESVAIDFSPFLEAGRLVFNSALVAERWVSYGVVAESHADRVHPAVLQALRAAGRYSAADAHRAQYRLRELRRETRDLLAGVDVLVTPTAGTIYRVDEVEAEPITRNANMGYYTYFANPLGLATISVPAGLRPDGLAFGLSISAPDYAERRVGELAARFHARIGGTLGATAVRLEDVGR